MWYAGCACDRTSRGDLFPNRRCRILEARGLVPFVSGHGRNPAFFSPLTPLLAPLHMGWRVPRVMFGIERLLRLPDGEHQVQEFAHDVADGDRLLVGMLGDDAGVEGPCRRVVAEGG